MLFIIIIVVFFYYAIPLYILLYIYIYTYSFYTPIRGKQNNLTMGLVIILALQCARCARVSEIMIKSIFIGNNNVAATDQHILSGVNNNAIIIKYTYTHARTHAHNRAIQMRTIRVYTYIKRHMFTRYYAECIRDSLIRVARQCSV